MKTEAIPNRYDGPQKPGKRPENRPFSLDYVNSRDASAVDAGIRETIKGVRLSVLAMGIGLARIKNERLFADLRCRSMAKYIEGLCEDSRMERSTVFNWLSIGETYLKYRKDLDRIGFSDEDGPTKLPHIERALGLYEKKDVLRAVKEMSLREFITFSKGGVPAAEPESEIRVRGNRVFIGGRPAVTVDEGLDRRTRAYLEGVVVKAGRALEAGEVLFMTRLYDMDELRRYEKAAERLKKELRGKK